MYYFWVNNLLLGKLSNSVIIEVNFSELIIIYYNNNYYNTIDLSNSNNTNDVKEYVFIENNYKCENLDKTSTLMYSLSNVYDKFVNNYFYNLIQLYVLDYKFIVDYLKMLISHFYLSPHRNLLPFYHFL